MHSFGSLILLPLNANQVAAGSRSDPGPDLPLGTMTDPTFTAQARLAAHRLNLFRIAPDMVLTPCEPGWMPLTQGVLTELRHLPRVVRSDRRLDVEEAWDRHQSARRQDPSLRPGWLSRTESSPVAGDTGDATSTSFSPPSRLELSANMDTKDVVSTSRRSFVTDLLMPLLSDRQTILLMADPHVIAQLRIVLNDSNARQTRDAELPTGQLLRYDFDRNLHPLNPLGSSL